MTHFCFFQALISSTFFRLYSLVIVCLFVILVDLLCSVWRPSGEPKSEIKAPFCPDAPRRVPGGIRDPCLVDLGSILDAFLDAFSMISCCALAVCLIWEMYEMCKSSV